MAEQVISDDAGGEHSSDLAHGGAGCAREISQELHAGSPGADAEFGLKEGEGSLHQIVARLDVSARKTETASCGDSYQRVTAITKAAQLDGLNDEERVRDVGAERNNIGHVVNP